MLTRCFLVDLSPLRLSAGEPESSVSVSRWDERDLIERLFAGAHSLAAFSGSGVGGSVLLSGSGQVSSGTVPVIPEPSTSERTLLSSCCSSIIFYEYLRWASILNCSCLWTYFILEDNYKFGISITIHHSVYSALSWFESQNWETITENACSICINSQGRNSFRISLVKGTQKVHRFSCTVTSLWQVCTTFKNWKLSIWSNIWWSTVCLSSIVVRPPCIVLLKQFFLHYNLLTQELV